MFQLSDPGVPRTFIEYCRTRIYKLMGRNIKNIEAKKKDTERKKNMAKKCNGCIVY